MTILEEPLPCSVMARSQDDKTMAVNFRLKRSSVAQMEQYIEQFKAKTGHELTKTQVVEAALRMLFAEDKKRSK